MTDLYHRIFELSDQPTICHKAIFNSSGQLEEFEVLAANNAFENILGMKPDTLKKSDTAEAGSRLFFILKNALKGKEKVLKSHYYSSRKEETFDLKTIIIEENILITSVNSHHRSIKKEPDTVKKEGRKDHSNGLLSDSLVKLSRAVQYSPVSIVITDSEGIVEYVNPVFFELTGYTPEEVIGKSPRILKSGLIPESDYAQMWHTIKKGETWKGEFINKKKNGELYFEDATIAPVPDENGTITHFVAVKEDVTSKKKYEQDLIDTKEKAREGEILKAAFLQNMSHEIRTPMNAILGFSELSKMSGTTKEKRDSYLDIVIESTHRLLGIVDDIMDISKLETGNIILRTTPVRLPGFMQTLYKTYVNSTGSKVILKEPVVAKELQKSIIHIDSGRLRQVLEKLLSNAVKFTTEGTIRFGCTLNNGYFRFFVEDTGIGIQPDMYNLIFQPFYQLDMGATRTFGGNGLGLTIASRIVEKMGSSIVVDSKPGNGSIFYFDLVPEKVDGFDTAGSSSLKSDVFLKSKYNMIVAGENEMNYIIVKELIKREFGDKMKIMSAHSANHAIELCRETGNVDFVLLDLKLKDAYGDGVARQLKTICPNAVVIGQTGRAASCDKTELLQNGCDDVLPEPISTDETISLIYKHIRKETRIARDASKGNV